MRRAGWLPKSFGHLDEGTRSASLASRVHWLAPLECQALAGCLVVGAALHGNAGNGGDAGQRLATEAHGRNGVQLLGGGELAGGVPVKRHRQIFSGYAFAVVDGPDELDAAALDFHSYL